ncbi:MAG: hypothetical protein CMD02_03765 [Flavobacteriales bacterium]|nr:hypothetical protein [Flavobacteriales bacterium]|tara:strand:+ start:1046 stop:1225 length:180 start_codon:yes stop_codon:yes gene_type:complete
MFRDIFCAIGNSFQHLFEFIPMIGEYINYFFMIVIFVFLVLWTVKMFGHRKRGEEHASS